MLSSLLAAWRLKDETRTGWELRGVRDPESVADHSWGTAYLVLLFAGEAGVDRARAVEIAVVHDLAEAVTGDIATRIAEMNDHERAPERARNRAEEKARSEADAILKLTSAYRPDQAKHVTALWREYEERATPEARLVREMNLIDMCLQALLYERDHRYDPSVPNEHFPDFHGLDEFFATTRPRLTTEVGRRLFDEIATEYDRLPHVAARGGLRLDPS